MYEIRYSKERGGLCIYEILSCLAIKFISGAYQNDMLANYALEELKYSIRHDDKAIQSQTD